MSGVGWFELHLPTDLQPEAALGFVRTLAMRSRHGLLGTTDPVVFELRATANGLRWLVAATEAQQGWLQQQIHAYIPDAALTPIQSDFAIGASAGNRLGVEVRVRQPMRPLRSKRPVEVSRTLIAGLGSLATKEAVTLQWIVGPWLPRHVPKPSPPDRTRAAGLDPAHLRTVDHLDYRDVRALEQKQEEPVYGTVGRVIVGAPTPQRRRQLAQHVVGAMQLLREPGTGLHRRVLPSWWVLHRFPNLGRPVVDWPCPLNAAELTALLGWPFEGVAIPGQRRQRLLAPTPGTLIAAEAVEVLTGGERASQFRIVGRSEHPAHPGYLSLGARDALQHLHVIAPTGAGKSTLLANLALQDMAAGRTVVVVEPKGDLIEDLLDRIPQHRLGDVVLIDPTDVARPVGFNVLSGSNPDLVVDQVLGVLHELYAAHWGPRTQDILHAGLLTLARAGGFTLIDLPVLLTDPNLRRRLIPSVQGDLALGPFWAWFNSLSDGERFAAIGPVMNKLRTFTLRESARHLLGQATPAFRFDRLFVGKQIVLVKLAKGQVGPETANLLGALVISQLWNAILGRGAIPPERRAPAMVYVDEFHDYTRLPTDLGDALAQARGLGVSITLAHQHLSQLSPDMRSAVLSNARSRITFQASDDAPALAKALGGGLTADDLRNLDAYQAYASLVSDNRVTPPASISTLPLPPATGTTTQVRAQSRQRWSRDIDEVRQEIHDRQQPPGPDAPVGRKRRSS